MERRRAPTGLLAFPLTPFTRDDSVDLDVFAAHVRNQIAAEPAAIFAACGTGEFTALSLAEYCDVVATAVKEASGRLPVYAGAGGGPKIAREFAAAAAEAGADGVLVLPPYLVSAPAAGVVDYVRYVAEGAVGVAGVPGSADGGGNRPMIVYQRATAKLTPQSAIALLDIPNVVGLKDGNGDVDAMLRIVSAVRTSGHPRAHEFGFLNGIPTAELAAAAYRAIGVDSYSSASLCFVPDIATAFYDALVSGDRPTQQRLLTEFYLPFAALRDQVPGYAVALVKAGARLEGLDVGTVRPPLVEPTPEHVDALAAIIQRGRAALAEEATR